MAVYVCACVCVSSSVWSAFYQSVQCPDSSASKRFETACNKLCSEAVLKMSGDNVTVVIVAFDV